MPVLNIPSARLTVPRPVAGEIKRNSLIDSILNSRAKLVYIHAGAGYGKTTLMSQTANSIANAVWLSLDGEDDLFTFINTLCAAVNQLFPQFDFSISEYLPFAGKDNFISILAGALICSLESIAEDFILFLDDLHTIKNEEIKRLITSLIKYIPKNARFCFGSREAPWKEFISFKVKGDISELSQKDLAFTREETALILGFDDPELYSSTEGWPLAIGSYRVLLENGIFIDDISSYGKESLYTYLFRECLDNLNPDMVDFLKKTACFDQLDAQMLDVVLEKKNTRLILESLVTRNIFTIKTGAGFYRYHSLFRSGLLEKADKEQISMLLQKAAVYYFDRKQYSMAAYYAIKAGNWDLLQKNILACYKEYIKTGNYNELRLWFQALDEAAVDMTPEILVAKGTFLSVLGNFVQANACLEATIPLLNKEEKELYFEAMIHKARVLRNFVSFGESNRLLDELIAQLDNSTDELAYFVVIEKLYNLCMDSQVKEALALARHMIESCAKAGSIKVMRWFERYLSTIYFLAGNMKESVYYYEKSLELSPEELVFLGVHSTGIYVAKAYQMLGDRNRSLTVLSEELQRLRNTGNYEEMWAGYLLAAEIHYQNSFIDKINGQNVSFDTCMKYFTLADEYAPLYRKTDFQMQWAKLQRLTYSLIFTDAPKEDYVQKIFENLNNAGAYLKSVVLSRLMGYFFAVADYPRALKSAQMCIEVGEKTGMLLHSTMAYGILARAAIAAKNHEEAVRLTGYYLRLCNDNGIFEYFRLRQAYDPVLEFAFENGIEPKITRKMMEFAGYKTKKIYVETLGAFTVYQGRNRQTLIKFRTKKERELLAFLLNTGNQGATKEQINSALWWESDSKNIKNLIAVNLRHLKKDLERAGVKEAICCRGNRYYISCDEIECDSDIFEKTYKEFKNNKNKELAKKLLSLYKGEYLADFEALWSAATRIEARDYCLK